MSVEIKTYITGVFFLVWLITGLWAHFVSTDHVIGELPAIVVTASAPSRADHLDDHLFELVRSGPQVVKGSPASCVDLCTGAGICASCPQEFHRFNSFRGFKWTIQLQKSHRKFFPKKIDLISFHFLMTLLGLYPNLHFKIL